MKLKRSPFIALAVLLIIILSTGTLYLYLVNKTKVFKLPTYSITGKSVKATPSPPALPKKPSVLDGTLVDPNLTNRHPLGVMIENHPDARPQYGLSSASVVYEAIAEGGITRFLAIFGSNDAAKVGPIRSARTYFADWCNEYDCFYAHVGGNYDALYDKIPGDKIKDIDEFANALAYHREPHDNVALEHTMYSSTNKLWALANSKKWTTFLRDDYAIYSFLDEPKTPGVATVSAITIDFSTPLFLVKYEYDKGHNTYMRSLAGAPHIDAINKQQLVAKNIIIQYIGRTDATTVINEHGFAMPTVGSGKATMYQGGTKIEGTWKKPDKYSRTQFLDASGALIKLYAGPTWIEIVNPGSTVKDS